MRKFKDNSIALSRAEHFALVEATRRRLRFNERNEAITNQWTGLGTASTYKAAVTSGFMERVSRPNPRYLEWWRLTEQGARIVQFWIDNGATFEKIEAHDEPPSTIPAGILAA